ncbi:hypothetical protein EDC96DRAFT_572872 [Choanephora cucurbitarum]|nr:hypothetical protein EDC96DRAFT_572872 [Choanephora cucurbitarum]
MKSSTRDTACLPKKQDGLGLVDPLEQSLALQAIYVQRLLLPPRPEDYLSPWLAHCFRVHTGLVSLLPVFLYPKQFRHRFRALPPLLQLLRFLMCLPPLILHPLWDNCWFFDLPIAKLLVPRSSSVLPINSEQMKYLISDLLLWSSDGGFEARRALAIASRRPVLLRTFDAIFHLTDSDPIRCSLNPTLANRVTLKPPQRESLLRGYPSLPSWMPSTEHWLISPRARKVVGISIAKPGHFRRHWQYQQKAVPTRVPFLVPAAARLPHSSWKLFWSLPLPAKAFTPWWRLLYGTIGHASKLHGWNPHHFTSPLCPICGHASETLYHFFVNCGFKWSFWQQYFAERDMADKFTGPLTVWYALTAFSDPDNNCLSVSDLTVVGMGLATLWRYHWQVFFEHDLWNPAVAVALCKESHFYLS